MVAVAPFLDIREGKMTATGRGICTLSAVIMVNLKKYGRSKVKLF